MKKTLQLTLFFAITCIYYTSVAQTRYLDDIFTDVTVEQDVVYGNNISVLPALQGLPPAATDLLCDIYHPTGDTLTNRPVIILAHTGSFLPPVLNGQPTGSKSDSSVVEQCMRWAKKGYVAIAMDNRLGWNPTSTDQNTRTSTLIQASYRGIQDSRSLIRFMRQDEANGNTYGIDGSKIAFGGQGTGGYLSLGVATLDTTVRKVVVENLPFLMSDTVGFIRKLPTQLVDSFKSTLDEVRESDLLLHIVDISHPSFEEHINSVNKILNEIQALDKPTLMVFNKIDVFKPEPFDETDLIITKTKANYTIEEWKDTWMSKSENQSIFISALNKENLDEFRKCVYREVRKIHIQRFPYNHFLYPDL